MLPQLLRHVLGMPLILVVPVVGMLIIDMACSLSVSIVSFWSINEIICKVRIIKEGLDAWDNFMTMKFKVFAIDFKVQTLKGGCTRQRLVNNVI